MTTYCSYKDCFNLQRSFSSKTFFNLPTDHRREIWIKNSGNERLQEKIGKGRTLFCEDHFDPKFLRRQFNRTTLRRDAVPYTWIGDDNIELIEVEEPDNVNENGFEEELDESKKTNRLPPLSPLNLVPLKKRSKISNNKPGDNENAVGSIEQIESDEYNVLVLDESNILDYQDSDTILETTEQNSDLPKLSENNEPTANVDMNKLQIPRNTPKLLKKHAAVEPSNENASEGSILSSVNEMVDDSKDDETYFVLSLAGILKRLPPHKRAVAKCHILTYLTELEYGSASLPQKS